MSVRVERVADRSAEAQNVIGVKVGGVVEDAVVVRFRPDKEISPHPIVESTAHVNQKVIAVQVGGATGRVNAAPIRGVVTHALAARTGGEDRTGALRDAGWERVEARGEDNVEVIQHRAVFLIIVVERLLVSKGDFPTVPETVFKNAVEAGA